MAWLLLAVAGSLEVGWAALLPSTNGLRAPVPTAAFVAMLAGSMVTLALATRSIPMGTAYSVWVGIGAVGAAAIGIFWRGDPATPARLLFLVLLVAAVAGLKLTSGH